MEVESSTPYGVVSLSSYFDVSPNGFAWRAPRPEQIMDRRADMNDKLIFDILLTSGGIRDPDFLYPPRDVEALERLLDAIQSSTYDALKKHTLVYFLLKWHQDGREDTFKLQFSIPPQFSALADAYWYLDSGINVPKAVSILSDSRLNRDYASKIIHAITLAPEPGPLILKYVRTTKPPLVELPDMLRYILALAEASFLEAWQYQRTFSETDDMRPRLFKKIVDWAIFPIHHANALKDLISLPLSKFEQGLLSDYALHPPAEYTPSAIAILQDLVCVRYIELGKYIDAIKLDRKFTAAGHDGKDSSDRKTMIRELYEALPYVEKSLLDSEFNRTRLEKPLAESAATATGATATPAKDVSMTQSWEKVPVPENLNKSTSTPLRRIQIPPPSVAALASSTPQFTVSTSMTAPAAGASTAAPPPLLPVSSTPSASANGFTPRKSQPLSVHPAVALGRGRPSLSGVGQRLVFGGSPGISSPASGMKFPVGSSKPPSSHGSAVPAQPKFASTVNQANAFYQPKQPAQKKPVPEATTETDVLAQKKEGEAGREKGGGMEVDQLRSQSTEEVVPGWKDVGAGNELNQSIFGAGGRQVEVPESLSSGTRARARASGAAAATTTKINGKQKQKQKQPPGAFAPDEDVHEHDEPEPEPTVIASRRRSAATRGATATTRTSTSAHAKAPAAPVTKPLRRTRQLKAEDLGRSIPGSLMNDEVDEEDEEEDDQLAPLREPSPPPPPVPSKRARGPVRTARSVASVGSDAGSDGEGPRRRSSRLSTTGSMRNLSPEEQLPKVSRKSGRASTSKRKK